jgi:septum formation protein
MVDLEGKERREAGASSLAPADGPPIVLASGSATRAALLTAAGVLFSTVRPMVDEAAMREALRADGAPVEAAAVALAEMKAVRGGAGQPPGAIVIGGDQLLELEGDWLEKAVDRAAARAQLLRLRGSAHRLVSAVVVVRRGTRVWHAVDSAKVWIRPFSETFLDAYLGALGDTALASVGVYQLEGLGGQLVGRVQGDHFTVQGLPLLPLLAFLRDQGALLR